MNKQKSEISISQKSEEQVRHQEIVNLGEKIAGLGFFERNWKTGEGYWSEGFYKLLGENEKGVDCRHEDFISYVHKDDVDMVRDHIRTSLEEKISMDVEFRIVQKNGNIVHIHGIGRNFYDTKGLPLKTIGTFMDISESKRVEAILAENEAKFRSFIDHAPYGVLLLDESGKYLEVNPAACKITGYFESELLNKHIVDLLQESEIEKGLQYFELVKNKGFARNVIGYIPKNAEKRFWEIAGVKLSDNRILGFVNDITESQNNLEELKNQNSFVQMILDNFPIGIATNEMDTQKINYINPKFSDIYGWSIEQFPTIFDFFKKVFPDPDKREKLQKRIMMDIESGDPERMNWDDLEITTQNGLKKIVHAYNIPLFDQNIMVSTVQDITQKRKAEKELIEKEKILTNIIENSTNMFYSHTVDNQLTFVSQQVREYLGCEPKDAIKKWTEFVTDNPINEHGYKLTQKAIETGERQGTYELELRRADGQKILVEVREAPIVENGKVSGIVGSLVDITERKKSEEEIKNITRRLKISTESASIGIWELDL